MITLQELQAAGGFVDTTPVAKTIRWRVTPEAPERADDFFIVRQPFGAVEQAMDKMTDNARARGAQMISMSVRLGASGDERLTYEQAYNLHPALAWELVGAINEVNTAPKA